MILWSSKDDGKTWENVTYASHIQWHGDEIRVYYKEIKEPLLFYLELKGVGESNVAVLHEKDQFAYGEYGGDRTGVDRGNIIKEEDLKPDKKERQTTANNINLKSSFSIKGILTTDMLSIESIIYLRDSQVDFLKEEI